MHGCIVVSLLLFTYISSYRCQNIGKCYLTVCDPDRYAELTAALCGYNALIGEPYQLVSKVDPGIRQQIFSPNEMMNDGSGRFLLKGITAQDMSQCTVDMKTKIITNLQQYKKEVATSSSIGTGFGFSIEIEAEYKGVSAKTQLSSESSFSQSKATKKITNFLSSGKTSIAMTEASCITSQIEVASYGLPPFTDHFKGALIQLAKSQSLPLYKKKREFRKFMKAYGTHYMSQVHMGASITQTMFYTEEAKQKYSYDKLISCGKTSASFSFFGFSASQSSSGCSKDAAQSLVRSKNIISERFVKVRGSRPTKDIEKWAKQNFTPVPVSMELTPIVRLFDDRVFKQQGINVNSSTIKKWFMPLYHDICTTLNIDCKKKTGCGFDVICKHDEKCVDERTGAVCKKILSAWTCHEKNTPMQDDGDGESYSLARHNVDCSHGYGITSFQLVRNSDHNKYKFVYKCCSIQLPCSNRQQLSYYTDAGNGDPVYLDRQNVRCDSNQYLSSFGLERSGDKNRYRYQCCQTNHKSTCYSKNTSWTYDGDGNTVYLDRQRDLFCLTGYILNHFKLNRNHDHTEWRYSYTCCKIVA